MYKIFFFNTHQQEVWYKGAPTLVSPGEWELRGFEAPYPTAGIREFEGIR
ncbi:MAG: hypothetical protein JJU34_18085 [Lunatimonas sp.]|nr:hypothetical protein [Lunatimonas sp.]MCC5939195.1 hypothetical protein [Lunatimonas sp.]